MELSCGLLFALAAASAQATVITTETEGTSLESGVAASLNSGAGTSDVGSFAAAYRVFLTGGSWSYVGEGAGTAYVLGAGARHEDCDRDEHCKKKKEDCDRDDHCKKKKKEVPEPGTLALVLAALLGGAFLLRRATDPKS